MHGWTDGEISNSFIKTILKILKDADQTFNSSEKSRDGRRKEGIYKFSLNLYYLMFYN